MFSSGKLAMYFGFSSEYAEMEQRNPHLNFDVALVPQIKNAPFSATFGTIYGLSISKNSPNVNMGIKAIFGFIEDDVLAELERGTGLAPVKRSLLAKNDTDPLFSVFYKSALQARAWLEPDSRKVSDIFKRMIDSVNTGQKSVSGSVGDAKTLLRAEIAKIK